VISDNVDSDNVDSDNIGTLSLSDEAARPEGTVDVLLRHPHVDAC
jgi:hypothetical protein